MSKQKNQKEKLTDLGRDVVKDVFKGINPSVSFPVRSLSNISFDKKGYCLGCNWTCMLMSSSITGSDEVNDLIHSDRR